MKMFLKAASESSPTVISDEELHQLVKQQNKTALCEGLKKLIIRDNARLKKFVRFVLSYSGHVSDAALATLQLLDGSSTQWSLPTKYGNRSGPSPSSVISQEGLIHDGQLHLDKPSSSSNSSTPQSPMDIDTNQVILYHTCLLAILHGTVRKTIMILR